MSTDRVESLLATIAKRLPLQALIKFAKANDQTCNAAREAWETWQGACTLISAGRMFSDRTWMDTFTRTMRQRMFRYVNAAESWTEVSSPPQWVTAALTFVLQPPFPVTFQLRVRKDVSVVNVIIFYQSTVWLVLSSVGKCWQFSDSLPDIPLERKQAVWKALIGFKAVFASNSSSLFPSLPPPETAASDKHQLLAGEAVLHHYSSV